MKPTQIERLGSENMFLTLNGTFASLGRSVYPCTWDRTIRTMILTSKKGNLQYENLIALVCHKQMSRQTYKM